jgi:hypothetical protein
MKNPFSVNPTRTEKTNLAYEKNAQAIMRRYQKHSGESWVESPADFLAYLSELRKTLSKSSWRQYRAALAYTLDAYADYQGFANDIRRLSDKVCTTAKTTPVLRGAQLKDKKLSAEDIQTLHTALLQGRRSARGPSVVAWLYASLFTGLRPSEWEHARLVASLPISESGGPYLLVKNGKHSNGRANGEMRTLDLSNFTPEQLNLIRVHLENIKEATKTVSFEVFQAECSETLRRVARRTWPDRARRPGLYSGRHQFSANLKKAEMSPVEIAALMGHISTKTAVNHYARKNVGIQIGTLPRASTAEMATVHDNLHDWKAAVAGKNRMRTIGNPPSN